MDPARGPAAAGPLRMGARDDGGSRGDPLRDRGADRVAARPDRARPRPAAHPARPLGRGRVLDVCGDCDRDRHRARDSRRGADEDRCGAVERLFQRDQRTDKPDGGRSGRRQPPALAQQAPPRIDQDRRARAPARASCARARRRQVHRPGRHVRRGRRDLDRQGPLQHGPDPRDLDLHAARHAAAEPDRQPALPASTGGEAAPAAHRERARVVRPRAGAAQLHHRRERRHRHLHPRRHRPAAARRELRADLRRAGWR